MLSTQLAMEIIESVGWVVLGFAPTLIAMEAAWRISKRHLRLLDTKMR